MIEIVPRPTDGALVCVPGCPVFGTLPIEFVGADALVRRSQLHSVSAGAAKTPYPQSPSSFPNCDRFTGSQFGSRKFYNAARYLDDGGQATTVRFCSAVPPKGDAQSAETFREVGAGVTDS